jgi:DNA-binding beta-propeller fold protein YncE
MSRRSHVAPFGVFLAVVSSAGVASAVTVEVEPNGPAEIGKGVAFSARALGSGPITYTWNFGDGTRTEPSSEPTATHVYDAPGHYAVIVIARDQTGVRSASYLQTIHRPVTPLAATASRTIVHDAARRRVCNVNVDNDSVSCIDSQSFQRLFEAPVGRHPRSLAITTDGSIWVANQDDSTISVLAADGSPNTTIDLVYGAAPFAVVTNSAGSSVYATLQGKNEVVKFDAASHSELLRGSAGNLPTGIAVSGDESRILVTSFLSPQDRGVVTELGGETLAVVRTHDLLPDPGPDSEAGSRGLPNFLMSVVISPDETIALVPSKKDNVFRGLARDGSTPTFETTVRTIVSRIDLLQNRELLDARLDFNNRALGLSATFSPLGDYFFVPMLGSGGVAMVDAYSGNTVGGIQQLAVGPDGIAIDDRGRLFVHAFLSRKVIVLDASAALAGTAFELPVVAEVSTIEAEKLPPAVLAGKKIFYDAADPRMTRHGYLSCASCHLDGFEDGRVWDFTDRGEGLRNTTSLLGKRGMGHGPLHWSANFDEIQDFEHDIRNAFGGTGFMTEADFGTGTRSTTLGDPKTGVSRELDDLAAYVSSLDRVRPSPFRDPDGSLTEQGIAGRDVFLRAGCPSCHGGPDFTDSARGQLHDVGTLQSTSGQRMGAVLQGIDTPTLRGVWLTAPYLHDGSAATLLEVITSRNPDDRHGVTSTLSETERDVLVSYLLQIDNTALEDEREPSPPPGSATPAPGESGCGCRVHERSQSSSSLWILLVFAAACLRRVRARRWLGLGDYPIIAGKRVGPCFATARQ